jgi:hypothetical protein
MYRLEHRFEMRKDGGGSKEVSEQELDMFLLGVVYCLHHTLHAPTELNLAKRLFYPSWNTEACEMLQIPNRVSILRLLIGPSPLRAWR